MMERPTCGKCKHCERKDFKVKDEFGIIRDGHGFICRAKLITVGDLTKPRACSRFEEVEAEDLQNEYIVTVSATATVSMFIRAEDEFEARDKAQGIEVDPKEWDIDDRMVVETTLVRESMTVGRYPETEKRVERTLSKNQTKLF